MSENILVINTTSLFLFYFFLFSGPPLACTFASQQPKHSNKTQTTCCFHNTQPKYPHQDKNLTVVLTTNNGQLPECPSWYWPGQNVLGIAAQVKCIQSDHAESAWAWIAFHPWRGDTRRWGLLLPCCYSAAQSAGPLHQAAKGKNYLMVISAV